MARCFIMLIFVTVVFGSGAQAGEYTIGVEDLDYMPYYSSDSGDYKGYAREILDAFAEKNGHTFHYKPMPVNRLFKKLLDNSVDFKFPDNPHWQSDSKKGKMIHYSDSVVKTIDGVMVLPENKGKGKDSLKKLGTVMGFTPWQYKTEIDSGDITLIENSNFDGLLKQVAKKRIDGAYINPVVATYRLEKKLNMPGVMMFDETLPYGKNDYMLSTLTHKDIIGQFNRFLMENKEMVRTLKVKFGIKEKQ